MPKLKTHKTTQSRFQITGTGKIMRPKGRRSHLRRRRSDRAKRQFGDLLPVHPSDVARIRRLLPYGVQ